MAHCHISLHISIATYVLHYNSPTLDNTVCHKYKWQLGRKQNTKIPQPDPRWMQTFYVKGTNIITTRAISSGLNHQGIPISTKLTKDQDKLEFMPIPIK